MPQLLGMDKILTFLSSSQLLLSQCQSDLFINATYASHGAWLKATRDQKELFPPLYIKLCSPSDALYFPFAFSKEQSSPHCLPRLILFFFLHIHITRATNQTTMVLSHIDPLVEKLRVPLDGWGPRWSTKPQ